MAFELELELVNPTPKSPMPRRLVFPLPLLFSMSVVFEVPGGEVSPLVIPLRGLPVPPLLPLEGPPITVPRLIPNPIEFEFCEFRNMKIYFF